MWGSLHQSFQSIEIGPDHIDLDVVTTRWAGLIERFIRADDSGGVDALDDGVSRLLEDLRKERG